MGSKIFFKKDAEFFRLLILRCDNLGSFSCHSVFKHEPRSPRMNKGHNLLFEEYEQNNQSP